MKTSKTKNSRSFQSRLAAYSATAAAAVLATPSANAAVQNITSGTITLDNTGSSGTLDVGPFSIKFFGEVNAGSHFGNDFIRGSVLVNGGGYWALDLAPGGEIAGGRFRNRSLAVAYHSGNEHGGSFLPAANAAKTGYVGLKAVEGGHTYYGWLRVQVTAQGNDYPNSVSILSVDGVVGAYGLPGDAITAGELTPTPEPSTLALGGLSLLALGARGVRELRRRREQAAKN